jgi:hypothetical protein
MVNGYNELVLSGKAGNPNFIVFGLTLLEIESND